MSKHAEVEALLDWVWQETKMHTLLTGFTPNVVVLPNDMLPKLAAFMAENFNGVAQRDGQGTCYLFGKEVIWHQTTGSPRILYERDCGPARQKLDGTSLKA